MYIWWQSRKMRSSQDTLPDIESVFAALLLLIFPDIVMRNYALVSKCVSSLCFYNYKVKSTGKIVWKELNETENYLHAKLSSNRPGLLGNAGHVTYVRKELWEL